MALEPKSITSAEEPENPELADMTRRFKVSAALTVPLVLLAMAHLIPGNPLEHAIPHRVRAYLELALATPVVLWGGWPFFVRAWDSLVHRSPNMFTTASSRRSFRTSFPHPFAARTAKWVCISRRPP